MAEYVGVVVTGLVEGAWDSFDDGLTGREPTSAEVSMVNFSPGVVGEPAGATPYTVVEGTWDSFDDGLTGREPVGEIILVLDGVQDGFDDGLTGREFAAEIEAIINGFPEGAFGKRTSGYIVDTSGNPISLPVGAVVTLVGDTTSAEYEKAAKVGTDSFYEVFLEGGYDKWYLIVEKGSRYLVYKKDPAAPALDGDNLPDTLNLAFAKISFKARKLGRIGDGLS